METMNREGHFGVSLYGTVLILMLVSAIAGAMAGQYFYLPVPSAIRENQPKKAGMAPVDSASNADQLRQEQLDMRYAEAQPKSIQVQSSASSSLREQQMRILTLKEHQLDVQIPGESAVAFPTRQELWQEHLDLLAASHVGLQPSGVTTESAYDRYWALKTEQIK